MIASSLLQLLAGEQVSRFAKRPNQISIAKSLFDRIFLTHGSTMSCFELTGAAEASNASVEMFWLALCKPPVHNSPPLAPGSCFHAR